MATPSPALAIIFLLVLVGCMSLSTHAAVTSAKLVGYPDLPSPLVNNKTVASGSLVIAMDDRQNGATGIFNVRAYGLAVRLQYANVPVYWVIRSGKQKDAVDFTALAHQTSKSALTSASTTFAGGPLVIPATYAASALSLVSSAGFSDVTMYTLDEAVTVDVRHTLISRPFALVSNLSSYASTLKNVFNSAGLVEGTHFVVLNSTAAPAVISSLNNQSCYTMVAEPHYQFDANAPPYMSSVRNFVNSGGNFLAHCVATNSYENNGASFMSKYGVWANTTTANQNLQFPYPDLPFSQFIGSIDGANSGVTTEFSLAPPAGFTGAFFNTSEASWWQPNAYGHVLNNPASAVTKRAARLYISSAAKQTDDLTGGLAFYLGSHEYTSATQLQANGRRMVLNAFLIPASRPASCGLEFCPAGETCAAGPCQTCMCDPLGSGKKVITTAECCLNGLAITCPSPSPTASITPSPSPTATPSPSASVTPSMSPSVTPSPSSSVTPSPSITPSPSSSNTPSPTPSSSASPSESPSASPSSSASPSESPSTSPSSSASPSPSSSNSPSSTPSPSSSASPSESPSASPSSTASPSPSPSTSSSMSPSPSRSPSSSASPSPSSTPSPSLSPSASVSVSPSASPSRSAAASPSPSSSASPSGAAAVAASDDGSSVMPLAVGLGAGLFGLAAAMGCCVALGLVAWRRRRSPGETEILKNFAPFFVEVAAKGASQTFATVETGPPNLDAML